MANNPDLRKDIDQLIASLERAGVNTDNFKRKLTQAGNEESKLVDLMNQLVRSLESAENSASGLYEEMKAVSQELGKSRTTLSVTKSIYTKLTTLARNLRDDEQGITDLNKRQLKSIQTKYRINNKLLSEQKEGLEEELSKTRAGSNRETQLKAALKMVNDEDGANKRVNKKIQERLELEKTISKNMGVTGALVGGTGALMERLGMRSGIFHDAMEDAADAMRTQSKILGKNATLLNRLEIAGTGFSIVLKGFSAALKDPASILGAIVSSFLEVNKTQTEFIQLSGKSAKTLNGVQTEISTLTDLLQTSAELTKQIGLDSTSIFSPDQIAQISDAKELLGLSAEQGAQLGMVMKLTGESADELGKSIYDNVDAGVSKKLVYDDILSTSDDIIASTGGSTEELARAASAARRLGMNLQKVNQIADGLMEFETSIGNELEAQLLTGKNINLSKARELALNNDLQGVAEELAKNGATAAEFARMNRIQQESLAKALGMSREELGKMVLTEKAREGMTDEQIAAARGVTLEQSKQIDIQARIQKSVAKLAQAFAPVLEAVVPIVEALLTVVGPIASGIGVVANALSGFIKPLLIAVGAFKVIKTTMAGIQAIQLAINAAKGVGVFLDNQTLKTLGLQNTYAAYKLVMEEGMTGMAAVRAVLEETILGSIIAQTAGIVRNIGKATIELGVKMGIAAASLTANAAATFGVGAAIAIAAAAAAYAGLKSMTADDMVSPGYGKRTLMGPEGAIQLNNKDTVIAGTDLFSGGEQESASNNLGGADLSPLVTEIRQMKAEVSTVLKQILNKEGIVTLDGNKVGSALVLGSYKSS